MRNLILNNLTKSSAQLNTASVHPFAKPIVNPYFALANKIPVAKGYEQLFSAKPMPFKTKTEGKICLVSNSSFYEDVFRNKQYKFKQQKNFPNSKTSNSFLLKAMGLGLLSLAFAADTEKEDDDTNNKKNQAYPFSIEWLAQELAKQLPVLDLRRFNLTEADLRTIKKLLQANYSVLRILLPSHCQDSKLFEDIVKRNRNNFSDRPNDYLYAVFSQQVYQDDGGKKLPAEWRLIELCNDLHHDGYFGAAYINHTTRQIIVAHRGTEPDKLKAFFKDLTTDIQGIVYSTVTSQQPSALKFAELIRAKYGRDYHISFAGHSLGGWLAQVTTYHFVEHGYSTHAVTFDSPGGREIFEAIQPHSPNTRRVDIETLDITTYLSSPNLVNTCNTHLGTRYRIYPRLPLLGSVMQYLTYTLETHSKDRIVDVFNPETGRPCEYKEIIDWPSVDWKKPQWSCTGNVITTLGSAIWGVAKVLEEYRVFHTYAHQGDRYDPHPDNLSFHENYYLTYKGHYQTRLVNEHQLRLIHLPEDVKQFLTDSSNYAKRFDYVAYVAQQGLELKEDVKLLLSTEFQLKDGVLTVPNNTALRATDFRREVTKLLLMCPEVKKIIPYHDKAIAKLINQQEAAKSTSELHSLRKEIHEEWKINSSLLNDLLALQTQARLYLYADPSIEELLQDESRVRQLKIQKQKNQSLQNWANTLESFQAIKTVILSDLIEQQEQLDLAYRSSLAILYYKQRNYSDSTDVLQSLIDKLTKKEIKGLDEKEQQQFLISAYNLRAKAYRSEGNYEQAIQSYQKALEVNVDNIVVISSLSALLNDMAKYTSNPSKHIEAIAYHRNAERLMTRTISTSPITKSIILTNLGRGLQQLVESSQIAPAESPLPDELLKEAEDNFTQAIQLNANNLTAYLFRGIVYMEKARKQGSQLDKALADFDKVLETQPEHPTALRRKAMVLQELGQEEEALAIFGKALKHFQIRPWIPESHAWIKEIKSAIEHLCTKAPVRTSIWCKL